MSEKVIPMPADKELPPFTGRILFNGEERIATLNLNTITDAEDLMGDSIAIFAQPGAARSRHLRALIYCALREGSRLTSPARKPDPRITLEWVGQCMNTNNMWRTTKAVMGLLRNSGEPVDAEGSLAPFVPTPPQVLEKMFELVPVYDLVVLDLGCGDGNVLEAAFRSGAKKVIGYEMDHQRFVQAKSSMIVMRDEFPGLSFEVLEGKLTDADVSVADVVFIYLLQDSNQVLKQWLGTKMRPGAKLISHDFTMEDWMPTNHVEITDGPRRHNLYVYTIGQNTPTTESEAGNPAPTEVTAS